MDGLGGLSEISHTEKDKYHIISLVCGIKKKKAHWYREQIVGCLGVGVGGGVVGEMGERAQKVQISSYKMCKSWERTIQHNDYSDYTIFHIRK